MNGPWVSSCLHPPRDIAGGLARMGRRAILGVRSRGSAGAPLPRTPARLGPVLALLSGLAALLAPPRAPAQSYDSALAPYPERRARYDPGVEEILAAVEKNASSSASPEGAFSAAVAWSVESARKLDLDRQDFGPFSLKSAPNWRFPPGDPGYWPAGAFSIAARGDALRIEKPADDASEADWWQKDGEDVYSRAWSEDWPTIWRFHHDAFEAGMLAYPEGLGLLLWAFAPGEYLKRADHLERGEDRAVGGRTFKTLVATPSWIRTPLFLQNRTHFPFNESTLISWAPLRPVITYYVDPVTGMVAGAEFIYHRVTRDKPKDWRAGSKPGGLAIRCFAEEAARAPGGLWYPARIVGEVFEGEEIVRRTTMAVRLGEPPAAAPRLELPGGKRKVDPWPKYRASVYLRRLAAGDLDHANRLGLAASLAYEGADVPGTIEAVADAIAALEADPGLLGETFGGIDWELGFAVYECFWRVSEAEAAGVWAALPATSTWSAVLAKAVDLYGQYRPEERDRIETLLGGYGSTYAERRKAEVRKIQRERYRASLSEDLALRRALGEAEAAAHLERVLGELDRAGGE